MIKRRESDPQAPTRLFRFSLPDEVHLRKTNMQLKWALLLLFAVVVTAVGATAGDQPRSNTMTCSYIENCALREYRSLPDSARVSAIMSPPLALEVYQKRAAEQRRILGGFSASTTVTAELLDSLQSGEFELLTDYVAPASLRFTPIRFVGDGFVKTNVINRYLDAENQHVVRHDQASTAINCKNYSFQYVRTITEGDGARHHYLVKPRYKRVGLFNGEIAIDAETGSLRVSKGRLVKSPSFFVKNIEFEREYEDVEGFTVPVHIHSSAKARFVGRIELEVAIYYHSIVAQAVASPVHRHTP